MTRGTAVFQSPLCQPSGRSQLQLRALGGNDCWCLTPAGRALSSLGSFITPATDTTSLHSKCTAELGFPTAMVPGLWEQPFQRQRTLSIKFKF